MSINLPKTILEAAIGNGSVRRFRDFALVILDGEGALCVPNDTWLPAASWAGSRAPSGNRMRDRMNLLQRLDVLVTRRGTAIVSTTGAHLRLARLQALMKRDGLDVSEWNFPAQSVLDNALNPPQRAEVPQPDAPDADGGPKPGTGPDSAG
jgi:hypothetical protein